MKNKATLYIVGIGPGDNKLLTPLALNAIKDSSVIAGYNLYIELLPQELLSNRELIISGMMKEIERCQKAIDSVLSGKNTSLICSGDPGIYALAGLVLELLEKQNINFEQLNLEIIPGVPAVCAAAARLGAPLTHDFACISLSDLLTPWNLIEKRLNAALDADFVIALYNPSSKRRSENFIKVLELLNKKLKPNHGIGLVKEAYRPNEQVRVLQLKELNPESVDMLSILIIGNSQTRIIFPDSKQPKLLTPRGYADKYKF
ncbi:precorrin-3B C(17)-methyltransferase [Desulfovibrio litoralis]|uniref:Precorrin-3B C17-methyltransferase n=1 Tax=Desulfovibrio litoralis DSM 11393 TaxID=1121455 RepID=A0A1M7RRL5_9BACT|nr:precorrin-3B C(17)-methyltransferase [Desulfovibrio litoralis]SHN48708.1 precorrin-3B C17-methyltransferase [Desulfovibrio litoralis DSM 11393]